MSNPEILSALTTPFDEDGAIDHESFARRLEDVAATLDGVFVAGTTGEFLALDVTERAALAEQALEVLGPQRVVIHVGSSSTRQSLEITERVAALGAIRFAAITPHYLAASTAGITRHWEAIAKECGGELYGYVFPDVAVTDLAPADLPEVLESGITGLKVSGAASARVEEYLEAAPDGFKLWSGNDADLPATMAAGGTGTVSGVSSAAPTLWQDLSRALATQDAAAIAAAQQRIARLVPLLGPSIANIKHALHRTTGEASTCRMTIDQPDGEQIARIDQALSDLDLLDKVTS